MRMRAQKVGRASNGTRRARPAAMALALVACLTACEELLIAPGPEVSMRIVGRVTNTADGSPVPGLPVRLWMPTKPGVFTSGISVASDSTDSSGRYSIERTVECTDPSLSVDWPKDSFTSRPELVNIDAPVRCIEELQIIHITVTPLSSGIAASVEVQSAPGHSSRRD